MKITVQFKDPDGVYEGIKEAARQSIRGTTGLSPDERDDLLETREELIGDKLSEWISYGEYLAVTFDTEAKTAVVAKA